MKALLKRFVSDDQGLETLEYAIMLGLIVGGSIAIIIALGTWVYNQFSSVQGELGA